MDVSTKSSKCFIRGQSTTNIHKGRPFSLSFVSLLHFHFHFHFQLPSPPFPITNLFDLLSIIPLHHPPNSYHSLLSLSSEHFSISLSLTLSHFLFISYKTNNRHNKQQQPSTLLSPPSLHPCLNLPFNNKQTSDILSSSFSSFIPFSPFTNNSLPQTQCQSPPSWPARPPK